jgi:Transposase IS66 family
VWLWAFAGENVTVYRIAQDRGYEHAVEILGADFSGVLERDEWAPYRRFTDARHQTCHAHLLRRTSELIVDSIARGRRASRTPPAGSSRTRSCCATSARRM